MATTPTNNPVPSNSPRDLLYNAEKMDEIINGLVAKYTDRLGKERKTWAGLEAELESILASLDTTNTTFPDVATGLAASSNGQYFRVIFGSGNKIAFTWFRKIDGAAVTITSVVSDKYYDALKETLDQNQDLLEYNQSLLNIFLDKYFTELFATSGTGTTELDDYSLMKVISVINPATAATGLRCHLSVTQSGSKPYALTLLPGESVAPAGRSSPYVRHTIKNRQLAAFSVDAATGFVRFKALWAAPDFIYASIGNYNIYDVSGVFASVTQSQAGSVTSRSVSSFSGDANPGFQIAIPAAEITAAGFNATTLAGVTAYVDQAYGDLVFWCRSTTSVTLPESTEAMFTEGTVTVSGDNNISVSLGFYKTASDETKTVITDSGLTKYSAVVKNNLAQALSDAVSNIRVVFAPGEVPSAGNLVLRDALGTGISCQWIPDPEVNFATGRAMGYHSDGSLRSGSVAFLAAYPARSELNVELMAASNTLQAAPAPSLVPAAGGYSLSVGAYSYLFSSANGYQLASFTKNGVTRLMQYSAYLADQLYTVAGYDKPMQSGFKSIGVTAWGSVFTEVTTVLEYKSVRATVRTRLFVSGRVTVDTTFLTLAEIPENTLYGLTGRMESYSPASQRSTTLMCAYWADNGVSRSSQLTYCHGHIHRDGDQFEARLPVWAFTALPTSDSVRLYGGWMYRSTSYPIAAVAKGTAFAHGFVVELEQKQADLQSANDATHNLPTGYAGKGVIQASARRQLQRDLLDYVEARSEYWDGYFDANGISKDQNTYAAHLALLKYGVSRKFTFGQIYANFKAYIDTKFGGAANLGTAYKNKVLILQFASRATLPNILWLYKEALATGDTAKQSEMKTAAASLAEAMVSTFNEKGFVPLIYTDTAGNSNSNATALRALAIAVHLGMDTDGRFASTINSLENVLKTNYALNQNILSESVNGQLATNQYLHYSMYAFHDYYRACTMLNRPLAFDMTTYVMTSLAAYGALREQEFCISNSRKGSSLTYAYHISVLNALGGLSGQNACRALLGHMKEQMNPDNTMPRPMDQWPPNLNTGAASPVPFELQALSEILLDKYYG